MQPQGKAYEARMKFRNSFLNRMHSLVNIIIKGDLYYHKNWKAPRTLLVVYLALLIPMLIGIYRKTPVICFINSHAELV